MRRTAVSDQPGGADVDGPPQTATWRRWRQRWYHTFVDKTTLYLPADLKLAVKRVARMRGVSEAEVIRDSIRNGVAGDRPRPKGGLFASGAPIARRDEEHLTGFGER